MAGELVYPYVNHDALLAAVEAVRNETNGLHGDLALTAVSAYLDALYRIVRTP